MKTTGRNDRCPCGSGKKYKKCHLDEDASKRTAVFKTLEEEAKARAAKKAEEDAEENAEESAPDKSKRKQGRAKDQSGGKARATGGPPKNIPRRGAV